MTTDLQTEIRMAMARRGFSQKDLSLKTGITEDIISRFLNGERGLSLEGLQKIFAALDLNVYADKVRDDKELIKALSKKLAEVL